MTALVLRPLAQTLDHAAIELGPLRGRVHRDHDRDVHVPARRLGDVASEPNPVAPEAPAALASTTRLLGEQAPWILVTSIASGPTRGSIELRVAPISAIAVPAPAPLSSTDASKPPEMLLTSPSARDDLVRRIARLRSEILMLDKVLGEVVTIKAERDAFQSQLAALARDWNHPEFATRAVSTLLVGESAPFADATLELEAARLVAVGHLAKGRSAGDFPKAARALGGTVAKVDESAVTRLEIVPEK